MTFHLKLKRTTEDDTSVYDKRFAQDLNCVVDSFKSI